MYQCVRDRNDMRYLMMAFDSIAAYAGLGDAPATAMAADGCATSRWCAPVFVVATAPIAFLGSRASIPGGEIDGRATLKAGRSVPFSRHWR
jgi:hypothetical protein